MIEPTMTALVPVRTVSETNMREHWAQRKKRRASQRETTRLFCSSVWRRRPTLPIAVRVIRVAPRRLDPDNLRGATKAIVDGFCDWLKVDDGDPQITWSHDQEKGGPGMYAVRLEVFEGARVETEIVEVA